MKLHGKSAVVTGASVGIGQAIAIRLATLGADVHLIGRSASRLKATIDLVRDAGASPSVHELDLRELDSVADVAADILGRASPVAVIANVAAVWHDDERAFQGPKVFETSVAELREVMDVGITAPLILTSLLVPSMVDARAGHVINVSGTFTSGAGWLHYYVSKKALEAFTRGLADELRFAEIQVNCISPADVATAPYEHFYPEYADTALAPSEIADVVELLLADAARHITGQIIEVRNREDHE